MSKLASRVNNINVHNTQMEEQTRKIRNQKLALVTLNVRTLRTEESEVELVHALEEIKSDILGLSKVRRMGEAIVEKENGDLWCHKGETPSQRGVGFIIQKQNQTLSEQKGASKQLLSENKPYSLNSTYNFCALKKLQFRFLEI